MKTILKLVLPFLLLSAVTTSCATTGRVAPANRAVITKLDHPKIIVHKNVKYYRSGGVWYVKKNRRYVTISAPVGMRVATLPRGYKTVRVRGVRYYKCKGVYYRKSGRKYIVVNV